MDKLLIVLLLIGVMITGYYGYQWYAGAQGMEMISAQTKGEADATAKQDTKSMRIEKEIPDLQVMSNEIKNYENGEQIAELTIPAINYKYPVAWGADDASLSQGVGMYVSKWTTTPDQYGHTVVSGHRETVFRELGNVSEGDEIKLSYNEKEYSYRVKNIWITDENDRTVIVRKETPTLTVTTCYPFDFIGNAKERYIIQAELVSD